MTKAGQGSSPSCMPSSPQERGNGRGHNGSNTTNCLNCQNGKVSQERPPQPIAYPLGMGQGAMELGVMARANKGLAQGGRAQPIGGTKNSLQCFRCQGWGHIGKGMPYPYIGFKPVWGELRECASPPCQGKLPKPAIAPTHFYPDPRQRPASMRAA